MEAQGPTRRPFDPALVFRLLLFGLALTIGDTALIPFIGSQIYFHNYLGDYELFWQVCHFEVEAIYGIVPFPYPPTALMLMRPFALLPFTPSVIAWSGCGIVAMVVAARRIVDWKTLFASLFTAAVLGVVIGGQVSLFVGALIIAGLTEKRPWLAGVFLACAAVIKPQSLLAAPVALIAARQYRTIGWAALTGLALVGVTALMWGPDTWLRWLGNLHTLPTYLVTHNLDRGDKGIYGLALHFGLPGWLFVIGIPLGIACTWLVFRSDSSGLERYAAFAASSILMSPYTLGYDLAGLTIMSVALLFDEKRKPLMWVAAALIASGLFANLGVILIAVLFCIERLRSNEGAGASTPPAPQPA